MMDITATPAVGRRSGDRMPGQDLPVLVVDDEAAVAEELRDGLAAYGFQVLTANSAAEARSVLDAHPDIGVVVTDIRMPGGDGLQLARLLLDGGGDASRRPEVVLITGHATLDDAEAAIRVGVSDFLRKPFRLAEAVRAVGAATAKATSRRGESAESLRRDAKLRALEDERAGLTEIVQALQGRLGGMTDAAPGRGSVERDLAAISHALRTPLNAIAGGTALLAEPNSGANAAWCVDTVRQGVADAVEAVELLEEFQRAARPAEPALQSPAALDRLLRGAVRHIAGEAAGKGVVVLPLADMPATDMPAGFGRIFELVGAAILKAALPGWTLGIEAERREGAGARASVVTFLVAPPGATTAALPDDAFAEGGNHYSQPQETLALAVARRLVLAYDARLGSWCGPAGALAIRLWRPG